MRRLLPRPRVAHLPLAALLVAACATTGTELGFPEEETGTVQVLAYLDLDGSRTPSALDPFFTGARIALLLKGSGDTVQTALTDGIGIATFTDVPLGEYRIAVTDQSLGDSVQVAAIDSNEVRLETTPDTVGSLIRIEYPEVSVREARTLPLGKRVFVRAVVLSGVQSFRDTTSHVSDSSGAIRLTQVTLRGGLTGNSPGDSVSVLGLISTRTGQPTLDQAILARFATRPAPVPIQVNTGTAASAATGALDANLVQISGATITDTLTVAPDFRVTVTDGSGSLVMVLDGNLPFARSPFQLGRTMNARGVLVPDGAGGWWLKPREVSDVVLF